MYRLIALLVFSLFQFCAQAQSFLFKSFDSIEVRNINGQKYRNPWAGGVIAPQFLEMDLNADGNSDLVVFDRSDNSIRTFIRNGTAGNSFFVHSPGYECKFPQVFDWLIIADYNCDGLPDLFSSGSGSVMLYKNIGVPGNPSFQLINTSIYATYNGSIVSNIFSLSTNIPAILDVDNDGDLDILGFDLLNSNQINYYKNFSKERYGRCDTLDLHQIDYCWGKFKVSPTSNDIITGLNNNCAGPRPAIFTGLEKTQHSGGTILMWDFDRDGDKDILLGDVDQHDMVLGINGGNKDTARITAKDTSFPNYNSSINIREFPASFLIDVDFDGKKDLIAAPNEYFTSFKKNQIWHYKNVGTLRDSFALVKRNFFESDMINEGKWSAPIAFDASNDGKTDLIVFSVNDANASYASVYQNFGTNINPIWQLTDTNWLNLKTFNIRLAIPSFGNLNADTLPDLLIGSESGKLYYFQNTTLVGQPASFLLVDSNYAGINAGFNASPDLADVDLDGKIDLVVGNRNGKLAWYKNIGTITQPNFALQSSFFGKVNVSEIFTQGFSVPRFADFNGNGTLDLVVGSNSGKVFFYPDVNLHLIDSFPLSTVSYLCNSSAPYIQQNWGARIAPSIFNLDGNQLPDILFGNFKGGINAVNNISQSVSSTNAKAENQITVYPNPANGTIYIRFEEPQATSTTFQLFDITGRLVKQLSILSQDNSHQLTTSDLANGTYFWKIVQWNGTQVGKIILQH